MASEHFMSSSYDQARQQQTVEGGGGAEGRSSSSTTSPPTPQSSILNRLTDIMLFRTNNNKRRRNDGQRQDDRNRISTTTSPWTMDSVQYSPMMTSPRQLRFGGNKSYHRSPYAPTSSHNDGRKLKPPMNATQRPVGKRRNGSMGNEHDTEKAAGGDGIMTMEEEELLLLKSEDEQWEQRRLDKIQKRNEKLSSSSLTAQMSASSSVANESPNKEIRPLSPTDDETATAKTKEATTPITISILYGIINAFIVLPIIMSFGNIIYNDEFFRPYLPTLIKLTVVSGIVHQLCFSTFSSLPFAVGQVQDAGLIFLSSMSSDIVRYCQEREYDAEHILATTTIGLGLATTLLGLSLILIGKAQFAQHVQKLPLPVVGGYLAYIGFFCGQSGLSLMSGVQVEGLIDWDKFFTREAILLILPGLMGGITIYVLVRQIRHMAVLPTCIVALIVVFHLALLLMGKTVEDATENGWISEADAPPVWYKTWDYLRFDKVVWSALPSQTLTLLSMVIVVALSSSLDVAAIELELNRPLDYNHELQTVGLSNVLSGLTGGYSGSYIFSQSIFCLRAGIRSRVSGYCLALCELILVVIPVAILSYVPNFFFGSLLLMICIDLMYEWLWDVKSKLTNAEYGIALCTFVLIQIMNVEYGILGGILLYIVAMKLGLDLGASPSKGSNAGHGKEEADEEEDSGGESTTMMMPSKGSSSKESLDMVVGYGSFLDEKTSSTTSSGDSSPVITGNGKHPSCEAYHIDPTLLI